jgi:aromatic ring-opening dioxygenase catalytic subunit (LigB family)
MFPGHGPHDSTLFDIPIVQASIDASGSSTDNEAVGRAVSALRSEGVLILSGGLTVHTFEDMSAFNEMTARPNFKAWDQRVVDSVGEAASPGERRAALHALVEDPNYKKAHPHPDHFMPLYVAAGAGNVEAEEARVIFGLYGASTFAFGL